MAQGMVTKEVTDDGVRWRVRVDLGPDPVTGKRRRPQRTYATKKEADAALATWLVEIERGTVINDSKQTVGAYLQHWLTATAQHRVRPTTYESYSTLVNRHIAPALGTISLQKLTPTQVQAFYAAKMATGGRLDGKAGALSNRTVRYLHAILKMALEEALRLGLVGRNAAAAVKPPKAVRPQIQCWDATGVKRFLAAAEGDSYGAIWHVALHTGMRCGELLGVRWADVDFNRAELRVRQTAIVVKYRLRFGEPKTKSGRRTIALDPATVAALREHRARQLERRLAVADVWQDLDLVFPSDVGTAINPANLAKRFAALIQAADVRRITIHGMRHTHATLLLMAGINVKVVSERLGHADISLTLSTYAHVLPQMQKEAAGAFAAALSAAM